MPNPNFPVNLGIRASIAPNSLHEYPKSAFGPCSQEKSIKKYGIAGRVWEAAYVMNAYVNEATSDEFDPPFIPSGGERDPLTIIELGSGTGITASQLATACGRSDLIIATDLYEVCALLGDNLRDQLDRDEPASIRVRPLTWGNYEDAFRIAHELDLAPSRPSCLTQPRFLTHIVCSDLVYFPELLAPLLWTLIQITTPPFVSADNPRDVRVILSYKIRSLTKEMPFWSAFGLWFEYEPVLYRPLDRDDPHNATRWTRFGAPDGIVIFVARRREGSFAWDNSQSDKDLLDGVGAYGTPIRKGDDTFETLLFLSMNDDENNE